MVVPVNVVPPSEEGFYAINNQFLANGPKGVMEFKTLENGDTFVRFDLPGVPKEGVEVFLDESKTSVCIVAVAPREHNHDFSHRIYGCTTVKPKLRIGGTKTELVCKCYEISSFTSLMSDGVLRLILTKTHTATQGPCFSFFGGSGSHVFVPGTDPQDPKLTGRELMPHPCVNEGSQMAYESKMLQNGKLFVRVDMPGVPKDNFTVSVTNERVKVTGEAPALSHDSSGRFYSGDVAMLSTPVNIPVRRIKTIAKNGVIRLIIPPAQYLLYSDASKKSKHDSSHRKYGTAVGRLICDCCEISNIQCFVEDGVVRLMLSKKKINRDHVPTFCSFGGARMPTDIPSLVAGSHPLIAHLRGLKPVGRRGTDPFDPAFTGPAILPHPSVLEGSTSAYESKQLPNGGLFLRIDIPGVPKYVFMVVVDGEDCVTVMGRAPATMYDSRERDYVSKVAIVPRGFDRRWIKMKAKHGVVRLTIPS